MWIHRRTGENSGISFTPGAVLLAVFALLVLAGMVWEVVKNAADASVPIFLVVVAVGVGALWRWLHSLNRDEREYKRLAAREKADARDAELRRLRGKYGD